MGLIFLLVGVHTPEPNIFATTHSHLDTSTELIFKRLSRLHPLTPTDELVRSKFDAPMTRMMYLRYGPDALANCEFCTEEDPHSYLLYYLAKNVLVPHVLLHQFVLGIATSASICGRRAAKWNTLFTFGSYILILVDVGMVYFASTGTDLLPASPYCWAASLRSPILGFYDLFCAAAVYLYATNRFPFSLFPGLMEEEETVDDLVMRAVGNVGDTAARIHMLNFARNAVVHDKSLKERESWFWNQEQQTSGSPMVQVMVDVSQLKEGGGGGGGGVNLDMLNANADQFVRAVTADLRERKVL